jgi:hypothetical protein
MMKKGKREWDYRLIGFAIVVNIFTVLFIRSPLGANAPPIAKLWYFLWTNLTMAYFLILFKS